MSFTVRIEWEGVEEMAANIQAYGDAVVRAVGQVADYFAPVMEAYAKEHGPWQDRTGNLRQTLNAFVEELSEEVVAIYLAHGMDYGLPIETRFQGRYSVIWPTIEAHLGEIEGVLHNVFGR